MKSFNILKTWGLKTEQIWTEISTDIELKRQESSSRARCLFLGNFSDTTFTKPNRETNAMWLMCILNALYMKCWYYCDFDRHLKKKDTSWRFLLLLQIAIVDFLKRFVYWPTHNYLTLLLWSYRIIVVLLSKINFILEILQT